MKPSLELLLFDIKPNDLAKPGELSKVQIAKTGRFKHPIYGEFDITKEDLAEMKQNFDDNAHRQADGEGKPEAPLNYSHERQNKAGGWIKGLELSEDGSKLFGLVKFTPNGRQMVLDEEFKAISPEIHRNHEDNENGKSFNVLLKGAALTNIPFLKDMQPVQLSELSEDKQKANQLILNEDDLDDDQTNSQENDLMKSILEQIDALPADQKAEITAKLAAGSKTKEGAANDQQLAEAVDLAAANKNILELSEKLETEKAKNIQNEKDAAYALLLSEGKIVPAAKEAYMKGDMNEVLKLNQADDLNLDENGSGAAADNKNKDEKITPEAAGDKLIELADALVAKDKISYSDAVKTVNAENKDLVELSEAEEAKELSD